MGYELIKTKPVFFPDAKKHGIAMSDDCKDFINRCLKKDHKERLGTVGGVDEIINHPWFKSLDVNQMLSKSITPEFNPKLSLMSQTSTKCLPPTKQFTPFYLKMPLEKSQRTLISSKDLMLEILMKTISQPRFLMIIGPIFISNSH